MALEGEGISDSNPYFFIYFHTFLNFISLLAALGLCCCTQAFSSCGKRGLLFVVVRGLLIAVASLCFGARALGTRASVVVAHGLSSCGSRALEHRLSSCGSRALEHRLSSCGSRALEHRLSSCGSRALEHRLNSCGTRALERKLSSCGTRA